MSLLHRLSHLLGTNTGFVVSGWSDGILWIGFHCDKCGKVVGIHPSATRHKPPTEWEPEG